MQPIHRRAVGLAEPGAATSTVVTLAAFERAVFNHMRRGALGVGTGRQFGTRGIHLAPPHSPFTLHILAESPPKGEFLESIKQVSWHRGKESDAKPEADNDSHGYGGSSIGSGSQLRKCLLRRRVKYRPVLDAGVALHQAVSKEIALLIVILPLNTVPV